MRIPFVLTRPGRVVVDVNDLAGRRVRGLADEWREAGEQAVSWDGRDASGRDTPAGLYIIRLESAGERRTGRVVRVR